MTCLILSYIDTQIDWTDDNTKGEDLSVTVQLLFGCSS